MADSGEPPAKRPRVASSKGTSVDPAYRNWNFEATTEEQVNSVKCNLRYQYLVVTKRGAQDEKQTCWYGYIQMKYPTRESTLANATMDPAIVWRRATPCARTNVRYMTEVCTPCFEIGEPRGLAERRRTDLDKAYAILTKGGRFIDLVKEFPRRSDQFYKQLATIKARMNKPRDYKTVVGWFYGPPEAERHVLRNVKATAEESKQRLYHVPAQRTSGLCMDGFTGQPNVLWSQFSSTACKRSDLLHLCGSHEWYVQNTGTLVQWNPRRLCIFAHCHPRGVYPDLRPVELERLLSKIEVIYRVSGTGVFTQEKPV